MSFFNSVSLRNHVKSIVLSKHDNNSVADAASDILAAPTAALERKYFALTDTHKALALTAGVVLCFAGPQLIVSTGFWPALVPVILFSITAGLLAGWRR